MEVFQSTRPRGARLVVSRAQTFGAGVSIHAPTRGATLLGRPDQQHGRVSIHAPTRGATALMVIRPSDAAAFQSTRPRGARPDARYQQRSRGNVSIHAPTRGATCRHSQRHRSKAHVSIHAPTRGATSTCAHARSHRSGFNPRAHAGRDQRRTASPRSSLMFQSTRPRGARRAGRKPAPAHLKFQSTRPRGARPTTGFTRRHLARFQSTRPRGARPGVLLRGPAAPLCFNPRAHAGRDGLPRRTM